MVPDNDATWIASGTMAGRTGSDSAWHSNAAGQSSSFTQPVGNMVTGAGDDAPWHAGSAVHSPSHVHGHGTANPSTNETGASDYGQCGHTAAGVPHDDPEGPTGEGSWGVTDTADDGGTDKVNGITHRPRVPGWTEFGADAADSSMVNVGATSKYEWDGNIGDIGPRSEHLETELFNGEHIVRRGKHFDALELDVKMEGPVKIKPIREFKDAGLHPVMLNNINLAQYSHPTPIQAYTIPAINEGMDVVGIAQTGTGKTAAYLIPVLNKLMGKAKRLQAYRPYVPNEEYDPKVHAVKAEPLVLIVVPTRELALQIFDEACRMSYRSMLRPCVAYGGIPISDNIADLGRGCDILIATPGRLCHLMDKPSVQTMSRIKYTILDEADKLLQNDWEEDLTKILAGGDTNEDGDHIYMMFSATFPNDLRALAREYMAQDHVRIKIGRAGSTHRNVKQEVIEVTRDSKHDAVFDLLLALEPVRTLIFCNTKIQVDLLDDYLYNKGLPTTSIHADRPQRVREDAMRAFKTGKAPILIATGVSARGWDIANVHIVINYELPSVTHDGIVEYIHRIGRTGRMGNKGTAYSLYDPDRNDDIAQDLVNVLAECQCEVPDFLSHLVPEDGKIDFHDDSDDEDAEPISNGLDNLTITAQSNPAEEQFVPDDSFGHGGDAQGAW